MEAYLDGEKGNFSEGKRKVEVMLIEINLGEKGYQWRQKYEGIEMKQSDGEDLGMVKELDKINGFQDDGYNHREGT